MIGVLLFRSWLPKIINIIRETIRKTANIAKQIIDIRFECLSCQKIGNNKEHAKAIFTIAFDAIFYKDKAKYSK